MIASAGMSYVAGSTGGDLVTPPKEPIVGGCHSPPPSDELGGVVCLGEAPDSLFLAYPDSGSSYGEAAHPTIKMVGGESRTLTFQLIPSTWGIYYIDVTVCYFNAGQPCDTGSRSDSDKVTPVVVGLFNIQGSGNGHAFGASSKLDDGGSYLISVEPE